MNDEHDELLDKLFQAARTIEPDTAVVEECFETRLMARIEERRNRQTAWSFWTWRLVPVFATIAVIVGIGSVILDPGRSGDLFASLTDGYEELLATSLLAGG